MAIEVLSDKRNRLLRRRELLLLFKGLAGRLTRGDAIEAVAGLIGEDRSKIVPVKLATEFGKRDVKALFYIYDDMEDARRQLPRHIFIRSLPKEERKRVMEEERRARVGG